MLIDARVLPAQAVAADVCIIGGGPAGISLAREFIGQQLQVALLESGGFEFDADVQALADGPTFGDIKPSVEVNHRQFGGNSNVWNVSFRPHEIGVRHAVFDEIDFARRDWVAHSGWPFERSHLMPYYERAQVVCHAGPYLYSPECWEADRSRRVIDAATELETGIYQFGPSNVFHEHYRDELVATRNITIYTHASVVELMADEGVQSVQRVRVARPGGNDLTVSAKVFVLAAGGFENARLLLMSNRQQLAGLGNTHDVVGRYYHDHLQGRAGYFVPADPELFNRLALYDLRQVNGVSVQGYLRLSDTAMRRLKVLNLNCHLYPRPSARRSQAIESFNLLRRELKSRKFAPSRPRSPTRHSKQVLKMLAGLDYVAQMAVLAKMERQATEYGVGNGGWSQLPNLPRRFQRFEVWNVIEQAPHPDNRVTLSRERDALGCPRLELHWHWSQEDIDQTLRAQQFIAAELERSGLGRLELERDAYGRPHVARPVGSHHLMGTTRMHEDPRQGVVDASCRVHGVGNLYVAGSSTFPAGGYANPTLTIVAMALRLADLLKNELGTDAQPIRSTATVREPELSALQAASMASTQQPQALTSVWRAPL